MKGSDPAITRRGLLRSSAGAAAAGVGASAGAGAVSAQQEPYGGYLAQFEANLFNGTTADRTGQDAVTIRVGAGDGGLAFDPPAVVVDPGTTVTWEWTGEGGGHNVINDPEAGDAEAELFNSGETVNEAGFTFEHTFEEGQAGAHPYFCSPHQTLGMVGVVAVGIDNAEGEVGEPEEIELLSVSSIFAGVAVGGGAALLGIAYRGMYGDEDDH